MKVLIAEDDAVSRTVVKKTIEKLGHECLVAEDGLDAWEMYRSIPDVDVIISDWMMPRMEGPELCRKVRALERGGHTFFIFLTALGAQEHLLEGMRAGADEYLTKPLDRSQLEAKLISAARVVELRRRMSDEEVRRPDGRTARNGRTQTRRPRAGGRVWDVLISQGKLTEGQLQSALRSQKGRQADLGKSLVSLGYITAADLAQAQARRLNLDYVDLTDSDVDREAVALVPEKMLRRHGALPLRRENGCLIVAMSDPTDLYALDDLRMASGLDILPVVATEENLQRTQARLLSGGEDVAEILESAGTAGTIEELDEVRLGEDAGTEDAPVVRLVDSILQRAVGDGASDIHFEPVPRGIRIRFRVDGVLREVMDVPQKLQGGLVARLKILSGMNIAERRLPQDGRFSARLGGQKIDVRATSLPVAFGEVVVLRLLDTSNLRADLADLGFEPEILRRYEEVFGRPYGTILVTGPTGSGKSTTLYATLGRLNSPERKIITVEDPVEYRVPGLNQIQVNPRAGLTFASGLRSILRADPDIVMIGEIRDRETAKIAVEAALTGHLVLATLHTHDAPGAVTRRTEMG
ncbi:MAG: ATPase, T2SS/T4P/T4SS family, partial [Actinomycetota bacterium]